MTTQMPTVTQTSPIGGVVRTVRPYLGGRRGLVLLAAVALIAGAALNWGWLVAAGVAPLLLTALPCVAMCALGLCANKMMGKSGSTDAAPEKPTDPAVDETSPTTLAKTAETQLQRTVDRISMEAVTMPSAELQRLEERRTNDA